MTAHEEQRTAALKQANRIRLARVDLRHAVRDGIVRIETVVCQPPEEAEGMSIYRLLAAQRGWGRTRALRFLRRIDLSESRQLGDLTPRQRDAVVDGLRG